MTDLKCILRGLVLVFGTGCSGSPKSPGADSPDSPGADSAVSPVDSGATDTAADVRDCDLPNANPPDTREGHPGDGWAWEKQGPLFEDTVTVESSDGDLAPSLVDTGSELVLIFARKRGTEQGLWRTTSADGVSWTQAEPVEGIEAGSIEYPSLVFADGIFHLWHGSGSIGYAHSTDGLSFTPGETALRPGEPDAFDGLALLYPHAVLTPAGVRLFYTGYNGARFSIGSALSTGPAEPFGPGELLLEHDMEGWDNTSVGMPELVVDSAGTEQFWYGGYDTAVTIPGPWRIGRIEAETGERQVSLPLSEAGVDAWSTRDPAVVPHGDGWLMVYVGMGDDGVYRLLRATSRVCN